MEDWRLNGQEDFLFKAKLKKTPSYDLHTHCDFCWAKFSTYEEDLKWGYTTYDERFWICEECFNDFKDRFQWEVDFSK